MSDWKTLEEEKPDVGRWFVGLYSDQGGHPGVAILVRLGDVLYRDPYGGINRDLVRMTNRVTAWSYGPSQIEEVRARAAAGDEIRRLRVALAEAEDRLATAEVSSLVTGASR